MFENYLIDFVKNKNNKIAKYELIQFQWVETINSI